MGYKNFREVYKKILLVVDEGYTSDTYRVLCGKREVLDKRINSALVYGYIDRVQGVSYKVLGLTYYKDGDFVLLHLLEDVDLTIRGADYQKFELRAVENRAIESLCSVKCQSISRAQDDEDLECLRALKELDRYRHPFCPDLIYVMLFDGKRMEGVHVLGTRPAKVTPQYVYFYGRLMTEPTGDFPVCEGEEKLIVVDTMAQHPPVLFLSLDVEEMMAES